MENVMTNGFCELNEQEMMMTDGGVSSSEAASNGFGYYLLWSLFGDPGSSAAKLNADKAAAEYYYNIEYSKTSVWDKVAPVLVETTPGLI